MHLHSIHRVLERGSRAAVALICALLTPATAFAQDTRAELIAREQAAKLERLRPEEAGPFERAVVRVMSSPLLAAQGGVYPWFGSVFPGSKFAAGIGYLGRYARDAELSAIAGASVNRSTRLEASLSGPRFARGALQPRVTASWLDVRNVSFYGLGQESPNDSRVGYEYSPKSLRTDLAITPARWLDAAVGYEWLAFDTGAGTAPPATLATAPGFGRDLRYGVARASIAVDSRTSPGYSTHGSLLRAAGGDYRERRDAPYDFQKTELEAVQLVPLVREQFVLAFRGLAAFTHTPGVEEVPLPLLPYIGGGSTVRGFQNRRFADRNLFVLTGEYRWRPSRSLDMAVFVDAGQVAPERRDLALNRLETAWGVGARFHGPTFTALRIEAAHSARGFVMIFAAGPPF